MPSYATKEELVEAVDGLKEESVDAMLLAASGIVRNALRGCVYRIASDGLPADVSIRATTKAATLAQARFWVANGYNPETGEIEYAEGEAPEPIITSESQDGLSQTYLVDAKEVERSKSKMSGLAPVALLIIKDNPKLRRGPVRVTRGGSSYGGW